MSHLSVQLELKFEKSKAKIEKDNKNIARKDIALSFTISQCAQ